MPTQDSEESVRWDVFLAHAGQDVEIAQKLNDLLSSTGVSVCFDRTVLRAGDDWHALLPKYLRQSGMVVALVSSATREAHYERSEIVLAVNLVRREGRRLVPVRVCADAEMPYGIEQLHTLEAFGEAGLAKAAEVIVDLIRNPGQLPSLKPTQVWCDRVPVVTKWFTGRDELVRQLYVETDPRAAAVRTYIISGMGGIGKTTVAATVAEVNRHELDIVWWVRAEEEAKLVADLAQLAPLVGLAATEAEPAATARRVRQWLEDTERAWLLVFDNAPNEEILEPWRPKRGGGIVIVTSRNRNFDRSGSVIELGILESDDAEHFLRCRVQARNPTASVEPAAKVVGDRLGGLPLALEQAAAWVARAPNRRFSRYLELLDDVSKEPFPEGTRPLTYDATAATTWRVSIQAAAADAQFAGKIMEVLAFFAPDALPLAWVADNTIAESPLLGCTKDQVEDALVALHDYSLVQLGTDTVSVHRVVQQAARRSSDVRSALLAAFAATKQIDSYYRDPNRADVQAIAVHVAALCTNLYRRFPDLVRDDDQMRALLESAANWSDRQRVMSCYFEALLPAASVFSIRRQIGGLESPDTLRVGRVLVHAMEQLGMISEARALGNMVDEADLVRPEGSEPMPRPSTVLFGPEKITAMNHQAEQLLADGRHNEALNVKFSVLSATGWFYGHYSGETGQVFMDLARCCLEMDRVQDAVRYASKGFELLQRHLDHNDPVFGLTLMNLSGVQRAAGEHDEALKSIQDSLRILTAGLKQPHTVVGGAYGQLSLILESMGDFPAAERASSKAIQVLTAVHGAGHPIVAKAFANLALVLAKLEKSAEAIVTAQRALDLYRQTYGDDHWETRWARGVLETVSQS